MTAYGSLSSQPCPVAVYRDAQEWHVRQQGARDVECTSLIEAMAVAAELAWPRRWE